MQYVQAKDVEPGSRVAWFINGRQTNVIVSSVVSNGDGTVTFVVRMKNYFLMESSIVTVESDPRMKLKRRYDYVWR